MKDHVNQQLRPIEDVEYSQLKVEEIRNALVELIIILDEEVDEQQEASNSEDEEECADGKEEPHLLEMV